MSKKAFIFGKNTLSLKYAENDVVLMHDCLSKVGYEVVVPELSNSENIKTRMSDEFDSFIDNVSQTDSIIFYFSGHGHIDLGELHLVFGDDLLKRRNIKAVREITSAIASCKATNKLIILDCCKAIYLPTDWNIKPMASEKYRILVASEKLETKEFDEYKAGFLTFQLHRALTDCFTEIADDSGAVRVNELFTWLDKEAKLHNSNPKNNMAPIPALLGNYGGNFEIGVIPLMAKLLTNSPTGMPLHQETLQLYLKNLIRHNQMPEIVFQSQKLSPPGSTEIYVDLSAYKDTPDVAEKLLMEKNRVAEGVYSAFPADNSMKFSEQYSKLPDLSEEFGIKPEKLSEIFRHNNCMVLLGECGSGKTTFLKYITDKFSQFVLKNPIGFLAQNHAQEQNVECENDILGKVLLPIRVPIRHFAHHWANDKSLSFLEYLPKHFFPNEPDKALNLKHLFLALLQTGNCVLLLDGLDEIVNDEDRRMVAIEISEFVNEYRGKGNHFVITSRIPGYRYVQHVFSSAFSSYKIKPMDEVETEQLITKLFLVIDNKLALPVASTEKLLLSVQKRVQDILSRRASNYPLSMILSVPLYCGLLTMMYPDIPSTRTDLYEKTIKTLLVDWPHRKGITLSIKEKQMYVILNDLAYWMHKNKGRRYITVDEIRTRFAECIEHNLFPGIVCTIDELLHDFLSTAHKETGVFEERGNGLFGFPHLGFEEYFAARWISGGEDALNHIFDLMHQSRWRETLLMVISMTPYKNMGERLEKILNAKDKFEPILHRNLLFTADCICEGISVPSSLQKKVVDQLISIYLDDLGIGRYKLLRLQIQETLSRLVKTIPIEIVYSCMNELILLPVTQSSRSVVLEILEQVFPVNNQKIEEIRGVCTGSWLSEINNFYYTHSNSETGWKAYRSDSKLLLLLGLLWILNLDNRWEDILGPFLSWDEGDKEELNIHSKNFLMSYLINLAQKAIRDIDDIEQQNTTQSVSQTLEELYQLSPSESLINQAAGELLQYANLTDEENKINIKKLEDGISILKAEQLSDDYVKECKTVGAWILDHLNTFQTLAHVFSQIAQSIPDVDKSTRLDVLYQSTKTIEMNLVSELLILFQRTLDCSSYYETALLLTKTNNNDILETITNVILTDLQSTQRLECALYTLSRIPNLLNEYKFNDVLLHLLSNISTNYENLLLDVIFKCPIDDQILRWSWQIIQEPNFSLYQAVRNNLDKNFTGQDIIKILPSIISALNEPRLHKIGIELLCKITWSRETLPLLIGLLFVRPPITQQLAALRLAEIILEFRGAQRDHAIDLLAKTLLKETDLPLGYSRKDIDRRLAKYALSSRTEPEVLASNIFENVEIASILAASIVLYTDLYSIIVKNLLGGICSPNDFIRSGTDRVIYNFAYLLPTDGSTEAVQLIFNKMSETDNNQEGHIQTILSGIPINHKSNFWIQKWLEDAVKADEQTREAAELAISSIVLTSRNNAYLLLQHLEMKDSPRKLKYCIALAFSRMFCQNDSDRQIPFMALQKCLCDEDEIIRCVAAIGFKRATDPKSLWQRIVLLREYIKTHKNTLSQYHALKSMGRLLYKYQRDSSERSQEIKKIEQELFHLVKNPEASTFEWKGAAIALASLYHGQDQRIEMLSAILQNDALNILEVLLRSNAEYDVWVYDSGEKPSDDNEYYGWEVSQIVTWLSGIKDIATRNQLINFMVNILKDETDIIQQGKKNKEEQFYTEVLNPFTGWPLRRITVIVLAELISQTSLSASVLSNHYKINDVISTFTVIAKDPDSFNVRRFAIRILGELQNFSHEIAEVLFAGHLDVPLVYAEANIASQKFTVFESNSINEVIKKIDSPSMIQASTAALLIGRLGSSLSIDNQSEQDALVDKLNDLLITTQCQDFNLSILSQNLEGSLHDIVFDSLYKILSGKDFDRWIPHCISSAFLLRISENHLNNSVNPTSLNINILDDKTESKSGLQKVDDIERLRQQARQMQKELSRDSAQILEGDIGVIISGDQIIQSILVVGQPQDHLLSALNKAIKKSQEMAAKKLQDIPNLSLKDTNLLRQQSEQMQKELSQASIQILEGDIGVIISGDQIIQSILVVGQPQDHLLSALNKAIKKSQEMAAKKLRFIFNDNNDQVPSERAKPRNTLAGILSKREVEVLRHLAHDRSNIEIAQVLHISEGTVQKHIKTILSKLNVSDRAQAKNIAIQSGLVK